MGKHPSQSWVMGLQGKPTEQKTGISLDYLTPGLLTLQERIHIRLQSCSFHSTGTEQGVLVPHAVSHSRESWNSHSCSDLLCFSIHSTTAQTPRFSSHVLHAAKGLKGNGKDLCGFAVLESAFDSRFDLKANSLEKAECNLSSSISL